MRMTPYDPGFIDWMTASANGSYAHFAEARHPTEAVTAEAVEIMRRHVSSGGAGVYGGGGVVLADAVVRCRMGPVACVERNCNCGRCVCCGGTNGHRSHRLSFTSPPFTHYVVFGTSLIMSFLGQGRGSTGRCSCTHHIPLPTPPVSPWPRDTSNHAATSLINGAAISVR